MLSLWTHSADTFGKIIGKNVSTTKKKTKGFLMSHYLPKAVKRVRLSYPALFRFCKSGLPHVQLTLSAKRHSASATPRGRLVGPLRYRRGPDVH